MTMLRTTALSTVALLAGLALVGCPVPTNPPAKGTPAADIEACEHLKEGPAVAVQAVSPSATASIPNISEPHKRYDITLVASGSEFVGKVQYNSAAASEYIVFLNQDVPLTLFDTNNARVSIENSATGSAECAEVKGRHLVDLGVGTYTLSFGPTTVSSLSVVIEKLVAETAVGTDHDRH